MVQKVAQFLIKKGTTLLNEKNEPEFVKDKEANDLLLDLKKHPHAYVLGCVVDRQIPAERAWMIPYKIKQLIGSFKFDVLAKKSKTYWEELFIKHNLHRFNKVIADCFYEALQKINEEYDGDASNMWSGINELGSIDVIKNFLSFKGVGPKIATMAVNILVRKFGISLSEYTAIDVSADVHVRRVFMRTGLSQTDRIVDVISSARILYPSYPGVFDFSAWEVGKNWCRPKNPLCNDCYLNTVCPKKI